MHDVDDLDRVQDEAIDQQIVGMNDSFARAVGPARPVDERMIDEPVRACLDRRRKAECCAPVPVGNVI